MTAPVLDRTVFDPDRAVQIAARHGPVVRTAAGPWLLLGYPECRAVLRDDRFGSVPPVPDAPPTVEWSAAAGNELRFAGGTFYSGVGLRPRTLLTTDGPTHRRLRDWLGGALNGLPLNDMSRRISGAARTQADLLLDGHSDDVVRDFTEHVPLLVLEMLFGIPASHLERFRSWSRDVALLVDAPDLHDVHARERSRAATMNLVGYLRGLVARRSRTPCEDLVSRLVTDPDAPDPDDVVGTLMLLLIAGHETSIGVLGNAVAMLSALPDDDRPAPGSGTGRRGLVNELLRRAGPVQYVVRTALDGASVDGRPVPPGDQVLLMLAAANHDARAFDRPHEIDPVGRARRPGLAFGVGAHACIGAGLARMELDACLEPLLDLAARLDVAEPRFGESLFIRSPTALPIRARRTAC